jgi:hypothetical protein
MEESTSTSGGGTWDVSGAGGIPLAALAQEGRKSRQVDPTLAGLAALGFSDAEQIVAAAAIPGVLGEFHSLPDIDGDVFDSLLKRAQSALPPNREALMANPAPPDFGLGVPLPTEAMIAAAEASAAQPHAMQAASLPASVNLIPFMPPIRNQGARGTCVAFTLTALNEYVLRRRGLVQDLSAQHLYYETKLIDGTPDSCGTYQSYAARALGERGECPAALWPYDPNMPCNNHGIMPPQARPAGLSYRVSPHVVPPRSVASYKDELAQQRPVGVSIPVYETWMRSAEVSRSGRINKRVGQEKATSGHAVLLVGYQDTEEPPSGAPGGGYFIVRNSWGSTRWGYQSPYGAGYGTIPYGYITDDAYEAYSAVVPGVKDVTEDWMEPADVSTRSKVTIQVGPHVKITVECE